MSVFENNVLFFLIIVRTLYTTMNCVSIVESQINTKNIRNTMKSAHLYFSSLLIALLLLVGTGLLSCEQSSSVFDKDFDRSGTPMTITVNVYESRTIMNKAWRDLAKEHDWKTTATKLGFATWTTSEPYKCNIYVTKPKSTNSSELKTWGHELAHCVYGTYHEEGD